MDEITKKDGRTILFVSHNISAVQSLCSRAILLRNGSIADSGNTKKVIVTYGKIISSQVKNLGAVSLKNRLKRASGSVTFQEIRGIKNDRENWDFEYDEDIVIEFKAAAERDAENLLFYMALRHPFSREIISTVKTVISDREIKAGESFVWSVRLPKKTLRSGQYSLYFSLANKDTTSFYDVIDENVNIPMLNILPSSSDVYENTGFVTLPYTLKIHDKSS